MNLSTTPGVPMLVFAKPPRAGLVKTRLAQHLGPERAAELAGAFLADTLERLTDWGGGPVWLVGAGNESEFRRFLGPGIEFLPQGDGSLGVRLARAFETALAADNSGAVALGADTPHLPLARLDQALAALASGRVVLGPARDGGFYLLGVPVVDELPARMARVLTGAHRWGSNTVLVSMRRELAAAGVACHDLETFWDIDQLTDLVQLRGCEGLYGVPPPARTLKLVEGLEADLGSVDGVP